MSDIAETDLPETTALEAAAPAAPRPLNAKSIRRRLDKINASSVEGAPRGKAKKQARLAETILAQIAAGQIRNPVAAAQAFVGGLAPEPVAEA